MQCDYSFLGFCFVHVTSSANIFGFKDFIAALALLIIIYTISDVRYRFRLAVSPAPLNKISYWLIGFIGAGTLLTDIWASEKWLVPSNLMTTTIWQGILAALFLGMVITWMHYAFIKPPIFGRNNFKHYAQELYRIVLKGSETELPVIAHELAYSAESMVSFASKLNKINLEKKDTLKPFVEGYANDMLLLIANRKLCRNIVASSPITAIRFLRATAESEAYHAPIGLFARNISTEAIQNKDSSLYHEDESYNSGLLGDIKPLSHALYGNYKLVEALQNHSPLDIDYKLVWAWDADQFDVYCRAVKITLKSYLEGGHWGQHSYVLTRALSTIQETTGRAIWDINKSDDDYIDDAWHRLDTGVDFIKDCVDAIGELESIPEPRALRLRHRERNRLQNEDLYDRLAEVMFKISHSAAYVKGPPDRAWSIHRNTVWSNFFGLGDEGDAWKIVQFKLRRLLYDEIRDMESFPNYKNARVLGICLNVMGLKTGRRSGHDRHYAALQTVVLAWTQRNYLKIREMNAEVADACLIGGITFDAEQSRLVKTYAKGLRPEPDRDYLLLQQTAD